MLSDEAVKHGEGLARHFDALIVWAENVATVAHMMRARGATVDELTRSAHWRGLIVEVGAARAWVLRECKRLGVELPHEYRRNVVDLYPELVSEAERRALAGEGPRRPHMPGNGNSR